MSDYFCATGGGMRNIGQWGEKLVYNLGGINSHVLLQHRLVMVNNVLTISK